MKIRNCFVSNSSSSSFILASKEKVNKESLLEYAGIEESSLFYGMAKEFSKFVLTTCKYIQSNKIVITEEDTNEGFVSIGDANVDISTVYKLKNSGMEHFYVGEVSGDDYNLVSSFLYSFSRGKTIKPFSNIIVVVGD